VCPTGRIYNARQRYDHRDGSRGRCFRRRFDGTFSYYDRKAEIQTVDGSAAKADGTYVGASSDTDAGGTTTGDSSLAASERPEDSRAEPKVRIEAVGCRVLSFAFFSASWPCHSYGADDTRGRAA
jgi:hypothetical protein